LRRKAKIVVVLTLLICSAITSFPFLTLKEFRLWFAIPYFYGVFCCVMNTGAWYLCGQALVTAARALIEQVEHVSKQ
jgi:protein-S-isoprenylcysteine O-methyltransferase Ste14